MIYVPRKVREQMNISQSEKDKVMIEQQKKLDQKVQDELAEYNKEKFVEVL